MAKTLLVDLNYRDAFRAQYYIPYLEKMINDILFELNLLGCKDSKSIVLNLIQTIAYELDDILLPSVIFEIRTKNYVSEDGETPNDRYASFFIDKKEKKWSYDARNFAEKYQFIFESMKIYCESTAESIKSCLKHLKQDSDELCHTFSIRATLAELRQISLSGSDRHRNGQTVMFLTFKNAQKLVYKNCDANVDKTLETFIRTLQLPAPYNIKLRNVLFRGDYGWYEYIEHKECENEQQLKEYYIRAGSLMAALDLLNYCDGHCENLIACGSYPVILDYETVFHNFESKGRTLEERSVIFTGLVSDPDKLQKEDKIESMAGLQAAGSLVGNFQPVVFNDHTTNIKLFFACTKDSPDFIDQCTRGIEYMHLENAPCLNGQAYTVESFLEELLIGYDFTYNHIKNNNRNILDQFLNELEKITSARIILRSTMFYIMLIRRLQQPLIAVNELMARGYLTKYLHSHSPGLDPNVVAYEINELLQLNVPYFMHQPQNKHLFSGNGDKYLDFFDRSAIEQIRENINNASDTHCCRQKEILRRVIKTKSNSVSHSKCYAHSSTNQ
jgi:type 2 lantibiotic biosynthesis protein LanM